MITFKSAGHLFASALKATISAMPKIEAALVKAEASKTLVEAVTAVVDPSLVPLEDAGYAVLGEVVALLNAGGDAAAAKLADAGLDLSVINQAKAVLASLPQISALAKSAAPAK